MFEKAFFLSKAHVLAVPAASSLASMLALPLEPEPVPQPGQRAQVEVDGQNRCELLFTPAIDQDIQALFLKQISQSDEHSLHVVIADQAGFHLPEHDGRIPRNVKLLPLPPYSPELNPVERFGGIIKSAVSNRIYPSLEKLEAHIEAVAREWSAPAKVTGLIHEWLAVKANSGVSV